MKVLSIISSCLLLALVQAQDNILPNNTLPETIVPENITENTFPETILSNDTLPEEAPQEEGSNSRLGFFWSVEDRITRDLANPSSTYKYGSDSMRFGPDLKVEKAFYGEFPISVAVSKKGRKFVSFPHWDQNKGKSLIELRNGKEYLYPNSNLNNVLSSDGFNNIHALYVDALDRLWALDTGMPTNNVRPVGPARFFVFNLKSNSLEKIYTFPKEVQLPGSILQDIRFDADMNFGFITDAGVPGIAVLNLKTGESFRRLHNHTSTVAVDNFALVIEGKFIKLGGGSPKINSNGVAISKDKKILYYAPVSSRKLYSISVDALSDKTVSNEALGQIVKVEIEDKGSATAGLITDDEGKIYLTNLEHNSVTRFDPETKNLELFLRHPTLLWPDTLAYYNRRVYLTVNQMNRRASYNGGADTRKDPYFLFSFPI